MTRKIPIRGSINKGKDPYNILASTILGREVTLEESGRDILLKQILELECKESIVLLFFYGFIYGTKRQPLTHQIIGVLYHVTSARIEQIEKKAINRLRHHKRISLLKLHIKNTI
jgi:DNA-directed RNA polymerase sigma subunit (sigma70/sigma32)